MTRALRTPLIVPALLLGLGACGESGTEPVDEPAATLTVAAISDWAFVDLDDSAAEVPVADPVGSSAWDVAFYATSVMLNGGDAGPGGVEGYCVCQNAAASDTDVLALTEEAGLADFEAVGPADVPTEDDAWVGDALSPAISGWWSYNPMTHVVSPVPDAVVLVRLADGTAFAKLHVIAFEDATQQHAGKVTLEFAVQSAAGEPMGATQQLTVDLAVTSPAWVDVQSAAVVDDDGWDVSLEGYEIRVNGGVSGEGQAGAVASSEAFDDVDDAGGAPSSVYRGDTFGGVFASTEPGARWYRYNLQGNHQIWPTHNVYLVRRGSEVFKLQLVSYYSDTGEARHITFRYERITG